MKKIKISVLITTFNSQLYIEETVKSILLQNYKNFEVIIIDNNSVDETVNLIKNFKDTRIKIKILDKNYGQTFALNYGLKFCKGDYIARIDSDDLAMPDRLLKQINLMEKENIDLLSTQVHYINSKSKIIGKSNFFKPNKSNFYLLLLSNPIAHPSIMIKKKIILNEKGYNQNYYYWQDIDLWIKLFNNNKVKLIDNRLTKIRIHKNQISKLKLSTIDKNRKMELINLITEHEKSKYLPKKIKVLILLKKEILIFLINKKIKNFFKILVYLVMNIKNIFFNKFFFITININLKNRL